MTRELIVPFHDETIQIIIGDDGGEYVPLKPLCVRIGIDWNRQRRRLKAASKRWGTAYLDTPSAGGDQEMTCIPRVRVGGWLYSITPNLVKEEVRDTLIRYQQELDLVIDAYLSGSHTQETATLRRQNRALKALALSSSPILNRIRTLAEGGWTKRTVRILIGKSFNDAYSLFDEMHESGLLLQSEWDEGLDKSAETTSLAAQGDLLDQVQA